MFGKIPWDPPFSSFCNHFQSKKSPSSSFFSLTYPGPLWDIFSTTIPSVISCSPPSPSLLCELLLSSFFKAHLQVIILFLFIHSPNSFKSHFTLPSSIRLLPEPITFSFLTLNPQYASKSSSFSLFRFSTIVRLLFQSMLSIFLARSTYLRASVLSHYHSPCSTLSYCSQSFSLFRLLFEPLFRIIITRQVSLRASFSILLVHLASLQATFLNPSSDFSLIHFSLFLAR